MTDREADLHEVFAAKAKTPSSLWTLLTHQPVLGLREIPIPPSEKRAVRQAILARCAPGRSP